MKLNFNKKRKFRDINPNTVISYFKYPAFSESSYFFLLDKQKTGDYQIEKRTTLIDNIETYTKSVIKISSEDMKDLVMRLESVEFGKLSIPEQFLILDGGEFELSFYHGMVASMILKWKGDCPKDWIGVMELADFLDRIVD